MPEGVSAVAFAVLAVAMLGGALAMMLTRNVVHAAFWLLQVLVSTAGMYLLLSAEFLALVQVMVYAGAVSVLVLFVIMLTLRRREDATRPRNLSLGVAVMAAVFAAIVALLLAPLRLPVAAPVAAAPDVAAFGQALFTHWVLPFEIASGILLVALVGAVWWAGRGEEL
jgi:NAD(P)H-quinone oxidoreductase subunit 6